MMEIVSAVPLGDRRVLVVEDDELWQDHIQRCLSMDLAGAETRVISTESEFLYSFEEIACWKPDVVILDVMLKWATLGSLPTEPAPKQGETYHRAGLRCLRRLESEERTRMVPKVLFTVTTLRDLALDLVSLPDHVRHVQKGSCTTLRKAVMDSLRQAAGRYGYV
jgi:CheY-like chemotaxis protein